MNHGNTRRCDGVMDNTQLATVVAWLAVFTFFAIAEGEGFFHWLSKLGIACIGIGLFIYLTVETW